MTEKTVGFCKEDCVCAGCSSPGGRDGMVEMIKKRVFEDGDLQVVPVIPDDEDDMMFAYTIGMKHQFNLPELIVVLSDCEPLTLGNVLMQIGRKFAEHPEFFERDISPDIITVKNVNKKTDADPESVGAPVACFKIANLANVRPMMGIANSVYGDGVEYDVRQIILPDEDGKFHWDAGCHKCFHHCQPFIRSVVIPDAIQKALPEELKPVRASPRQTEELKK